MPQNNYPLIWAISWQEGKTPVKTREYIGGADPQGSLSMEDESMITWPGPILKHNAPSLCGVRISNLQSPAASTSCQWWAFPAPEIHMWKLSGEGNTNFHWFTLITLPSHISKHTGPLLHPKRNREGIWVMSVLLFLLHYLGSGGSL